MIVNPTPIGWQVIYQQAHALLAAQLAWAWPPFLPPARWVGLLAAIAQHDDEQAAWHGRGGHYGLTPAGAPANFTQVAFSLEQATGVLMEIRGCPAEEALALLSGTGRTEHRALDDVAAEVVAVAGPVRS